ncbi:hypothetical protein F5144DRAFT_584773 [Chaetomium tenue]|uniref:Uncharacterized protein n=1 Tax=Chaetomium tenue TaxID=1854479 RepID=A0ACB7NZR5_9PEZI|nr:hypothetical protein F5144DRAFT_584773 [Chaetomium globosum]
MVSATLTSALLATASLINVASAAAEARLLRGVCAPLPGSFPMTNTNTAMVGEVFMHAVGTGTYIDDLLPRWASIDMQSRGQLPYEVMGLYNNTGFAYLPISCYDDVGLSSRVGEATPYRVNTERGSMIEGGSKTGLMLEPYAYYVDGEKQSGVYLGAAGVVRWAWSQGHTANGNLLWTPRLMVVTDSDPQAGELKDGEVAGFLVAKQAS